MATLDHAEPALWPASMQLLIESHLNSMDEMGGKDKTLSTVFNLNSIKPGKFFPYNINHVLKLSEYLVCLQNNLFHYP